MALWGRGGTGAPVPQGTLERPELGQPPCQVAGTRALRPVPRARPWRPPSVCCGQSRPQTAVAGPALLCDPQQFTAHPQASVCPSAEWAGEQ